jgi:hypothetical protein
MIGDVMPYIQLRESRVERSEGESYAVFTLSESPDSAWIVRFEECLAKHSEVAVAVVDRRVRTTLPESEPFSQLVGLIERCLDEANLDGRLG